MNTMNTYKIVFFTKAYKARHSVADRRQFANWRLPALYVRAMWKALFSVI